MDGGFLTVWHRIQTKHTNKTQIIFLDFGCMLAAIFKSTRPAALFCSASMALFNFFRSVFGILNTHTHTNRGEGSGFRLN
jgi:hypothetical protein